MINKIVDKTKYLSISYLQKSFGFGYKKAREVLEMLIKDKVIVEVGKDKFELNVDKIEFNKRMRMMITAKAGHEISGD